MNALIENRIIVFASSNGTLESQYFQNDFSKNKSPEEFSGYTARYYKPAPEYSD